MAPAGKASEIVLLRHPEDVVAAIDADDHGIARLDESRPLADQVPGVERIYVDQVTPSREVKMTVQVGASFPLHAGSSSKAFLARKTRMLVRILCVSGGGGNRTRVRMHVTSALHAYSS